MKPLLVSLHDQLKFFEKTHEQFARDVGVSVSTVARWVNGRFNPSHLAQEKIREVIDGYQKEKYDEEKRNKGAA